MNNKKINLIIAIILSIFIALITTLILFSKTFEGLHSIITLIITKTGKGGNSKTTTYDILPIVLIVELLTSGLISFELMRKLFKANKGKAKVTILVSEENADSEEDDKNGNESKGEND